jgi:hypothetical protein
LAFVAYRGGANAENARGFAFVEEQFIGFILWDFREWV